MSELLKQLFSSNFMPHGCCYLWKPAMVWLHAMSDATITLAYYAISVALFYFVRKRRDVPFHWMFLMFGVFIFGCGTTHLMEVWTLWHGTYLLSGAVKAATAVASLVTAALIVPLVPRAPLYRVLPSFGQPTTNWSRKSANAAGYRKPCRERSALLTLGIGTGISRPIKYIGPRSSYGFSESHRDTCPATKNLSRRSRHRTGTE